MHFNKTSAVPIISDGVMELSSIEAYKIETSNWTKLVGANTQKKTAAVLSAPTCGLGRIRSVYCRCHHENQLQPQQCWTVLARPYFGCYSTTCSFCAPLGSCWPASCSKAACQGAGITGRRPVALSNLSYCHLPFMFCPHKVKPWPKIIEVSSIGPSTSKVPSTDSQPRLVKYERHQPAVCSITQGVSVTQRGVRCHVKHLQGAIIM